LGGKYLSLGPGGSEQMIPAGGRVTITQGSVSLEDLLGKFIFSVTSMQKPAQKGAAGSGSSP
jgi:phospholipid/cholesterol/gamma-HCH transport system substrate-binding protein